MQITDKQKEYLVHMLGMGSHVKSVNKGYRNYYCAGVGTPDEADLTKMSELGLVVRGHTINQGKDVYFFATDLGMDAIGMTGSQKNRAKE